MNMKNRTKLEAFMKRIGEMCNVKYRFHRSKNERMPDGGWFNRQSNTPREWSFEYWIQPVDDNADKVLNVINIPNSVVSKDDAIEYVLFRSDFLQNAYGCRFDSYEALRIALDLANIQYDV